VGTEIKQRHLELIDRIAQEPTDREAIHRTQEQIRAQQHRLQTAVVDHLLEEAAGLTADQRRLFFARIKARIEEARRPRPAWLREGDEQMPSSGGLGRGRP
jgi:isopropylmalate/homocitrate/citramalate synthase